MKTKSTPLTFKICAVIWLASLTLFACNNVRRAQKRVNQVQTEYPEVLADLCRVYYPPKLTPGKPDTTRNNPGRVDSTINQLNAKIDLLQAQTDRARYIADSLIYSSLQNRDTICAGYIRQLKDLINSQDREITKLMATNERLKAEYQDLKQHPDIVTIPIKVVDSAYTSILIQDRNKYKQQADQLTGTAGQLEKANRKKTISIIILSIVLAGILFFKSKR